VRWNPEALGPMLDAALLRYLAVAHFGRGRGEWSQGEAPPHWREVVRSALEPHRDALAALWRERAEAGEPGVVATGTGNGTANGAASGTGNGAANHGASPAAGGTPASPRLTAALEPIVGAALRSVLAALYPGASTVERTPAASKPLVVAP
jgi:hypothetical protein